MKKSFIVIILLSLVHCVEENKINVEQVISLNPDETTETGLDDIIESVEFLKLSSENDVHIGDITSLQFDEDRIYVLDTFNSQSLFIFDHKGSPAYILNDYGKGPGEFTGPSDFAIDESNHQIVLYDAGSNKLIYYDKDSLEFLSEKKISFFPEKFTVTENNYLFYLNNIPNIYSSNFLVTDKNLNIVEAELPLDENMIGYHFYYPYNFSSNDDQVYFFAPSDYYIYSTKKDQNTFGEYVKIDFGNRALPSEFFEVHSNNQSRLAEVGKSAYNISSYFETDTFIFFTYQVGKRSFQYYLKSKKSGRVIHTKHSELIESGRTGPISFWPMAALDNTLIWHQQPMTLQNYINSKKSDNSENDWKRFQERNKELIRFSQTITSKDNPYLIFIELDF